MNDYRVDHYRVDDLLRSAAARRPSAEAVRSEHGSLTYGELDALADAVAAELIRQGVAIGDRVGLYLDKSIEAVAAAYGAMRAGAAYVPIDPRSPTSRAAYVATDCGLTALVADAARIEELRQVTPLAAPRGICVGDSSADGFTAWSELPAARPRERSHVDSDLAYILYTSGSTGRPKGVAISHRSSLHFVRWAVQTLGLRPDDVLANHAPLHFDLSVLDLFGAAHAGATVCLVPPGAATFPQRLATWIRDERITVWYSVPSALSMLTRYCDLSAMGLDQLRLVLFAGEVFPVHYLGRLMTSLPAARFFNLYGPTETNVCTFEEVCRAPAPDDPPVPIGQPCGNTRCEVVDADGRRLTAVGSTGELVVHGSGVASGYWGQPEASSRVFPEPFTCRTGDIVEILDDAEPPRFRYLGRRDHMVKTRGYRVELGEVEAALHTHPDVAECVVVAVPHDLWGNELVAFLTACGPLDAQAALRSCAERVPSYMVPTRAILLPALPRNANDKYDRRQLAEGAASMARNGS